MGRGLGWAEGRACPRESAAYPEKVVEALGVSTELGQVVHEAVALLISKQVHQVAGVHPCKGNTHRSGQCPYSKQDSQDGKGALGGSHVVEQEGPKALTYLDSQECSRGTCPA